jgi:NAD(P)-dependent dehydrogenase (short-subunit alcohol dehydrogenase family)
VHESTVRLDVLVNNAGVHLDLRSAWHEPHLVEGVEVHWRTNYLGTAQLTRLLVPLLLATAEEQGEARVVNVVSKLHARGRNDGLDGHLTPYDSWTAYGTSKLALVHEAREIARLYGDRGLHGYSVHPGSVATNIADRGLETAPLLGKLRKLAAPLERRALRAPSDAARSVVFCATSAHAEPGGYHRSSAPSTPSDDARDEEAGRILWEKTSRWCEEA